jgi:hypothetical protein
MGNLYAYLKSSLLLYHFSKELSAFFMIVTVTVIGIVYLAEVLHLSNSEAE